MKKLQLFIILFTFVSLLASAQSVPRGMNYQAVARDKSGEILANQTLTFKISLVSKHGESTTNHFTEIQRITTNQFGLFTLVIGKGSTLSGNFNSIPWSTEDIWMDVAIKDDAQTDYAQISSSKLLTVPYAFHAETANSVSGSANAYNGPYDSASGSGSSGGNSVNTIGNGTPWTIAGNYGTLAGREYLGTSDNVDLVVKTNAIERMRIKNSGDISMVNNVSVGASVNLNTASGSTTNNGQFNVVGLTRLNNVAQSNTISDGSLVVAGGTGIAKNLNVGGAFNAVGASSFGGILSVTDATESTSPSTGALIVTGGVGIGKRLNVAGAGKFNSTLEAVGATTLGNTLTVAGSTVINNDLKVKNNNVAYVATIENTNTTTGDGLLIKLGKKATKNNTAAIAADAALSFINQSLVSPTTIANITHLIDADPGNDPSITDFIVATIPTDPTELLNFAQTTAATACYAGITVTNTAVNYLNTYLIDNANTALHLPFDLGHEISTGVGLPWDVGHQIDLGLGLPWDIGHQVDAFIGLPVNWPSFFADPLYTITAALPTPTIDLRNVAMIPGIGAHNVEIPGIGAHNLEIPGIPDGAFVLPALPQIPTINTNVCSSLGAPYNFARLTLDDAWSANPLNHDNTFITFADNSATTYALGAITSQSVVDWITGYITPKNVYHVLSLFGGLDPKKIWAEMKEQAIVFKDDYLKIGVQYSSGSGDYAEWLEREIANEKIDAGDIVGVKAGKITKDLSNAEEVMAVSFRPIVLGNIPTHGKEEMGNNVAFMGQIPVKVMGPVTTGDYIVGNMSTPGYGVAINPTNMTTEDYKHSVGRSWDTDASNGAKMVNTVVGVHNGEFVKIVQGLEQKIVNSDKRLETIEAKLDQLIKTTPAVNARPVGSSYFSKK